MREIPPLVSRTMDKSIELIHQLGFTRNEAKTYTALLACQPATAYELARQASIPTSKIYETVNKLVAKGVLHPIHDTDKGQEYVALAAEDFLARIREETLSQTDELLPLLNQVSTNSSGETIWSLNDELQIKSKVTEIIGSTKECLLVSLWPQELDWLGDELKRLESEGAQIAMVHFGKPDYSIGATYHHPVEKTLYEEKGGRGLTLVSDSGVVVIANYHADSTVDGAWSRNHSFVTVAEDYIKHDVYITKVTRFLERRVKDRFGEDYERLRDVFHADI
jgi:HTH-type transcriptional regulator, sugar sensing transcriptional regulator